MESNRETIQMRFVIPVNEPCDNGSVTYMTLDMGDVSIRVAKRKLRIILTTWGIPKNKQKKLINELCH